MIARLNVDGSTKKADWLDLILTLKDPKAHNIKVLRKEDGKISKKRDVYQRDNQGQWHQIMVRGIECNRRIRVTKENRQYLIQYI